MFSTCLVNTLDASLLNCLPRMVRRFMPQFRRRLSACATTITGEVIYLRVFGQPMIILGSYQAARDLLDKHSANFSSRPSSVMAQL